MKTKILKVEQKEFLEILTNEPLPHYRRHSPDHWEHNLGDLHGWYRYTFTEFLEQAYSVWMKNERKAETTDK